MKQPIFEIVESSGKKHCIYANGTITGLVFDKNAIFVNKLTPLFNAINGALLKMTKGNAPNDSVAQAAKQLLDRFL